jgi:O-antigen/teichoic acid export membrane protein
MIVRLGILAAPLGAVMAIGSVTSNLPRYFVERELGLADLGVFAAVTWVIIAATTVVGALGQSATPRLARLWEAGERHAFLRLTGILTGFAAALALGGSAVVALAGRSILSIVYTPEYAGAQPVFFWAAVASTLIFASSALGYCVTAMRFFAPQAPLAVATAAVMAIAGWLLVPRFGLLGAVGAMAAAAAVQAAGYSWILRAGLHQETAGRVD